MADQIDPTGQISSTDPFEFIKFQDSMVTLNSSTLKSSLKIDSGSMVVQARRCPVFSAAVEVITWGDPEAGGDSSSVQDKLKDVKARMRRPLGAGPLHVAALGYVTCQVTMINVNRTSMF